jgi:hypothetical protein
MLLIHVIIIAYSKVQIFSREVNNILVGRDSSVGIAIIYGLDGPWIESRFGARFSAPVKTGLGAHPASYTIGPGQHQVILSCVRVQLDLVSRCDPAIISSCNEFPCRREVASVVRVLLLQFPDLYMYFRNTLYKID